VLLVFYLENLADVFIGYVGCSYIYKQSKKVVTLWWTHLRGGGLCAVLQHNIVGILIATPHVLLNGSFHSPVSPGYILLVIYEQLWRCLGTVQLDCVGLPSEFTVVQL
jgi:hypothetical protein